MEMRVGWNDMGQMDGIYDETVRESEEGHGLLRSGAMFCQEKRQKTKESSAMTEIVSYERMSQGTK